MSRTTRKPRFLIRTSETQHINNAIATAIRYPNRTIRVCMTEQELEKQYQRQLVQYTETGTWVTYWPYRSEPPVRKTSGYKHIVVEKRMDEVIAKSKRDFSTYTRDGKWSETGKNTGFKRAAAKTVRRANAQFCSSVIRGEEYDDTIYPHEHLGDHLVWNFW
jgi:hypothetical protein